MQNVIKTALAVAVISVATARLCIDLHETRKKTNGKSPAVQSIWTTIAGSLTLVYAYMHDADPVLIIATWLNTLSASIALAVAISHAKSETAPQAQESDRE